MPRDTADPEVLVASAAVPAQASCEAGIDRYVDEMPIAFVGTVARNVPLVYSSTRVDEVDNLAALRPATVSEPVPDGASGARRPAATTPQDRAVGGGRAHAQRSSTCG